MTGTGQEMLSEFRRLLSELTRQIKADRYSQLAGKLWGAMAELPSYLDRCTGDLEEFVLSYPKEAGGAVVAAAKMFPASWVTPSGPPPYQRGCPRYALRQSATAITSEA